MKNKNNSISSVCVCVCFFFRVISLSFLEFFKARKFGMGFFGG